MCLWIFASEVQKRVSDPWELMLQVIASCLMGTELWSSERAASNCNGWAISVALVLSFYLGQILNVNLYLGFLSRFWNSQCNPNDPFPLSPFITVLFNHQLTHCVCVCVCVCVWPFNKRLPNSHYLLGHFWHGTGTPITCGTHIGNTELRHSGQALFFVFCFFSQKSNLTES